MRQKKIRKNKRISLLESHRLGGRSGDCLPTQKDHLGQTKSIRQAGNEIAGKDLESHSLSLITVLPEYVILSCHSHSQLLFQVILHHVAEFNQG